MVTLVEHKTVANYIGESGDTKPTAVSDTIGMPNGSRFLEMDTGKKYFWNADDLEWVELPESESGGGGEAVLINKNVDANGTYNASADSADGYKKVVVDVPNSYAAGDEGKVVSNGALVAQGSDTVTANDTYDTTLISELTVNVPVPAFETGTYIGAGGGNIVRTINTTKKWSHFLIVTEDTYSQLTTDSSINLYMAYGDAYGYTAVPINVKDGGYGALAVENRPPSSYDNWRSQLTFNDNNIKWAFMGNGAIMSPVVGANYKWFAW